MRLWRRKGPSVVAREIVEVVTIYVVLLSDDRLDLQLREVLVKIFEPTARPLATNLFRKLCLRVWKYCARTRWHKKSANDLSGNECEGRPAPGEVYSLRAPHDHALPPRAHAQAPPC